MKKTIRLLESSLNAVIVFLLLTMVILVFGNVVLRYVFNSGITWSEEMARFLFIWLVFLGAIVALKDNMHMGVGLFIKRFSKKGKLVVAVVTNVLILFVLYLILEGSWKMVNISIGSTASATGIPLTFKYGIGIVLSLSMSLIVMVKTYRSIVNHGNDEPIDS